MAHQFGERLWPTIVDHRARSAPSELVGLIPKGLDVADGYQELTFGGLARAVDACARWIEKRIGRAQHHETIAYMGSNDVRYLIVILASNKTGYQVRYILKWSLSASYHILTNFSPSSFLPVSQMKVTSISLPLPIVKNSSILRINSVVSPRSKQSIPARRCSRFRP